jgi:soluble lytic murein transglycosylase-like protein
VRPWRWAKSAVLALTAVVVLATPGTVSTGTGARFVPFKLTPRESSVQKLELELRGRVQKLTVEEIRKLSETINDEAAAIGLDPFLVVAIIEVESQYDVEAISSTGARGLMQILPSTFRAVSDAPRMFDPVSNIRAGVAYLKILKKKFKRPEQMLLAYNIGPGGVIAGGSNDYPKKVLSTYRQILARNTASN